MIKQQESPGSSKKQSISKAESTLLQNTLLQEQRSGISSQPGSLQGSNKKSYASALINEAYAKKPVPKLAVDMSREVERKYEWQNTYSVHENRFELVTLPQISSKSKKSPTYVKMDAAKAPFNGRPMPGP